MLRNQDNTPPASWKCVNAGCNVQGSELRTSCESIMDSNEIKAACNAHDSESRTSCESEVKNNELAMLITQNYAPPASRKWMTMRSILFAMLRHKIYAQTTRKWKNVAMTKNQNYVPTVSRRWRIINQWRLQCSGFNTTHLLGARHRQSRNQCCLQCSGFRITHLLWAIIYQPIGQCSLQCSESELHTNCESEMDENEISYAYDPRNPELHTSCELEMDNQCLRCSGFRFTHLLWVRN